MSQAAAGGPEAGMCPRVQGKARRCGEGGAEVPGREWGKRTWALGSLRGHWLRDRSLGAPTRGGTHIAHCGKPLWPPAVGDKL